MWSSVKDLLGERKNASPTFNMKKDSAGNTITVNKTEEVAKEFNEFFTKKIKKLREKTMNKPKTDPVERLQIETEEKVFPAFELKTVALHDLKRIMKTIKATKVAGKDGIDSWCIKTIAPAIGRAILHIINLSITRGSFPAPWKPQIVHPLYKQDDRHQLKNFRPVSHLIHSYNSEKSLRR